MANGIDCERTDFGAADIGINMRGKSAKVGLPARFGAAREAPGRAVASSRSRGVSGSADRSLCSCKATALIGETPRTRLNARSQLIMICATATTRKHFNGSSQYIQSRIRE